MKSSIVEIANLCEKCNVLFLQETWLCEQELALLNTLHPDFYGKGISSMNDCDGVRLGRPHGGLAILWRKQLGTTCSVKTLDDPRLLMLQISAGGTSINLLNTYLPYDDGSNLVDYQMYLARIDSYFENPYSGAFGDFNGNIRANHRFGNELTRFCKGNSLIISDNVLLSGDSFTFYSEAHDTVAWLDHLVSTHSLHSLVNRMWVDNSLVSSDHFPVFVELALNDVKLTAPKSYGNRINWSMLSEEQLRQFNMLSKVSLSNVYLDHSMILCDDVNCKDPSHTAAIERMYNEIVDSLYEAGVECCGKKESPYKQVAGWHDLCADHHTQARDAFHLWCINGRPRFGPIYQLMRVKRAQFKSIMRQSKHFSDMQESDTLAQRLLNKDDKQFWKEIKRINNKHKPACIAESVEGKSGPADICDMWRDHFQGILNSVPRPDYDDRIFDQLQFDRFKPSEVLSAILNLKTGKAPGPDKLAAEHFKRADNAINVILSILFNGCAIHNFLPPGIMDTVIVPVVKDTKGDVSSKDNYRPIAITSVLSKIIEILILNRYETLLCTSDNQFGFKNNGSTDMCVFTLKQIVDYYRNNGSPVYLCFLDASKAFDRVHHNLLFDKLRKRNVPHIIVRLLVFWYTSQTFVVRWCNAISESFTVSNGVRQGSILSPTLFNVYIDCLSKELFNAKFGCIFNGNCFNHLVYADDTVLLAPSPTALQKLIDICVTFADSHCLLYNKKKTKYMCIKPTNLKRLYIPDVRLYGNTVKLINDEKYLGYIIENDCYDNAHIKKEMRSTFARGNMLIRNFRHCSVDVKIKLYKTYCSSIYCCALISTYHETVLKKLHIAFNKMFKCLMNVPRRDSASTLFVNLGVDNFLVLRRKLVYSFVNRVHCTSNNLVCAILEMDSFANCHLKQEWDKVLY